jgi:hypothetical protein
LERGFIFLTFLTKHFFGLISESEYAQEGTRFPFKRITSHILSPNSKTAKHMRLQGAQQHTKEMCQWFGQEKRGKKLVQIAFAGVLKVHEMISSKVPTLLLDELRYILLVGHLSRPKPFIANRSPVRYGLAFVYPVPWIMSAHLTAGVTPTSFVFAFQYEVNRYDTALRNVSFKAFVFY